MRRVGWIVLWLGVSLHTAYGMVEEDLTADGDFNRPAPDQVSMLSQNTQPQAPIEKPPYDVTQPLTINDLWALSYSASPEVIQQQVAIERASADKRLAGSLDSWKAGIEGRLGWRDFANEVQDNHRFALRINKRLYDGNSVEQKQRSADLMWQSERQRLSELKSRYRLRLLQRYFEVLLADMRYRVANENMAVVYVALDKAKDQLETGEISDVNYAEKNYQYQQALVERQSAEAAQQQTRRALANATGFPDAIPDQLQLPALKKVQQAVKNLPDLETLQQQVLQNNPRVQALQQQITAQQAQVVAARAEGGATLDANAWVGALSSHPEVREGHWRFDLTLNAPLYDGGQTDAKVSQAKAGLHQAISQLQTLQQQLRDQVADLYFQLSLYQSKLKLVNAFGDYSDLYLDYSRALYEHEERTDLGDAMVRLSKVDQQTIQQNLQMAYQWATLQVLLGNDLTPELMPTEN